MPIVVGVDLGTTKITSLALDCASREVLAVGTAANAANVTSEVDRSRGRSEWDANRIVSQGIAGLKVVADQLGERVVDVAGIGITGQQHGVVLVGPHGRPVSPLINWQDRRTLEAMPVLAGIVSQSFDLAMEFTSHREEAAYGAALIASGEVA